MNNEAGMVIKQEAASLSCDISSSRLHSLGASKTWKMQRSKGRWSSACEHVMCHSQISLTVSPVSQGRGQRTESQATLSGNAHCRKSQASLPRLSELPRALLKPKLSQAGGNPVKPEWK